MAAYDIHRHFKALRADTGRRRGHSDPFATGFEDELDDKPSSSAPKKAAPVEKPVVKPFSPSSTRRQASPFVRPAKKQDDSDDDDFLTYRPKRETQRRLSPAPPFSTSRDRTASPASRRASSPPSSSLRSPSPKGEREGSTTSIPRHTVASPFAGTKYLQDSDSDSDEDAIASQRSGSQDSRGDSPKAAGEDDLLDSLSPFYVPTRKKEVKRVDKPKKEVSGISWRAFSEGRAEQRTTEIEALRTNLQKRGKSISFSKHVVTDDGLHKPLTTPSADKSARGRQRSPPRSEQDVAPSTDEIADGVERYDPTRFQTNPFTGQPIKRANSDPDANPAPNATVDTERRPSSASGTIPAIRVDHVAD